jgi:hypothetical protein
VIAITLQKTRKRTALLNGRFQLSAFSVQWVIPKSVLSDERREVLETTNRINATPTEVHVEKSHQTKAWPAGL